ncbi:MAG: formylglycine-generating enzyme family protein [Phycisphaerales bacterium]|nr:formylglycine-generating enzyme family protein [Phycisphaerales bacterium]
MPAASFRSRTLPSILAVATCGSLAVAQGNPPVPGAITPSAPSIPLTAAALANGVQNRITTSYGIEFVTVGAAGNAAWVGNGPATGRGAVGYDYRIGRWEVTTSQWVQFFNAAYGRPQSEALPHLLPPSGGFWGAQPDPNYRGPGQRWVVAPGQENRPVGNISWRMAAMYCNWLHNDQSTDRAAFLNGAYDVSTFGYVQGSIFTDQITHNAGARYWIPTWDEWVKAAHFDPNRNGTGQGGYWNISNASDTQLIYGPPSNPLAQANGGFSQTDPLNNPTGVNPYSIALGAYPQTQSPWGLLDVAGGTLEWTEGVSYFFGVPTERWFEGSAWTQGVSLDRIDRSGRDFPSNSGQFFGFRIASAIPSPSASVVVVGLLIVGTRRRR